MLEHMCDSAEFDFKELVYHNYTVTFGYEHPILVWNLCAFQTIRR
jgi:hypothetical protein